MKQNVINEKSINDINYEFLKKQFPHAVNVDEDGKYAIDPQKLQMSLDPSKANIKEDGYGLNWVGKKEAYHTAFSKNYKVLKPLNNNNSKNWDTTDNILIKGDNLDALKILRQNYFEAIKMIYIDPPYNTKNDGFIYNDNFTSSTEQTLKDLGYDKEYVEYIENIQGAKTHSGWLSFMYPRLLLARDLLKDDGVIFVSIDDNEVAQLRLLMNDIFGEDNFIADLTWEKKKKGTFLSNNLTNIKETILVYSKNRQCFNGLIGEIKTDIETYPCINASNKREIRTITKGIKSKFKKSDYFLAKGSKISVSTMDLVLHSDLKIEKNILIEDLIIEGNWRYTQSSLDKYIKDGNLYLTQDLYLRRIVKETRYKTLKDLLSRLGSNRDLDYNYFNINNLSEDGWGSNEDGEEEVRILLDKKDLFSNPKPVKLIKKLIASLRDEECIILDFFAGSGTTGDAVLQLNKEDGGNRKYILVQLPESIDPKKNKTAYDFVKDTLNKEKPTVFDITQERIKRAGEKIIKDDITKQDLDIGFRTFEIVEDEKQKIYQKSLEEMMQDDLLTFTKKTVESIEDILYNLLVAESLPLSIKIETLIKDKLYLASNVAFVLGDVSIDELIEKLKPKKELEYITIYSPNISDDKFTLECESAVSSIGIKSDKLRFRG